MQRNEFSLMPLEDRMYFPSFNVPQSRSIVHGRSCDKVTVGIKLNCYNFSLMTAKSGKEFASGHIPQLSGLVE